MRNWKYTLLCAILLDHFVKFVMPCIISIVFQHFIYPKNVHHFIQVKTTNKFAQHYEHFINAHWHCNTQCNAIVILRSYYHYHIIKCKRMWINWNFFTWHQTYTRTQRQTFTCCGCYFVNACILWQYSIFTCTDGVICFVFKPKLFQIGKYYFFSLRLHE